MDAPSRTRMMTRALVGALAAAALALSACAGDGTPTATDETVTTVTEEPAPPVPEHSLEPAATLNQHGVNAGHPLAADAGLQMLAAGGTAADAAIAAAFAVSVTEPYASGVGGGGSALIATQNHPTEFIDYREVVAADGVIPPTNTGIPGFVKGMGELHARHGTLPWPQLLEPAVRMAEGGVPATDTLITRIAAGGGPAVAGLEQFAPGGTPLRAGDTVRQPDLAATFRTLQEEGPEGFYTGSVAEQLTAVDGIDPASLERYEVQRTIPPQGRVGQYEVVSAAPALPGAALIQMLHIMESQGVADLDPDSAEYARLLGEAWVIAEGSIREELGDPDFTDVSVEAMIDPERNARLVAEAPPAPGAPAPAGPGNTTHITVVDGDGAMVSMTNTLTEFWGAGTEVGGFFLNDQLDRFNTFDTPQNQPEPGRRSVTWSNPTLVLDGEGRPVLGIGTPGGTNIHSTLANALVRWALVGQTLEEAVAAPRFRFDVNSQIFFAEPEFVDSRAGRELAEQGWSLSPSPAPHGSLQTLEIDYGAGTVSGPTDDRLEAGTAIADVEPGG